MTAIEWTDTTWNPVTGCDRVSPGCAHCYALDLAARLKGMGQKRYQRDGDPRTSGQGFGVTLHPDRLEEPLRWRKPRRVFVNSMSDLFHEEIPDYFIAAVFAVMAYADRHTFQVLTKRPERMRALLSDETFWTIVRLQAATGIGSYRFGVPQARLESPSSNVWLGVSIENRRFVHRADLLRETPAAVRFISAEPLLGPLIEDDYEMTWADGYEGPGLILKDIDWLIVGGESGPKARRMDPAWVRMLRDACLSSCGNCELVATACDCHIPAFSGGDRAFFFKQWGGRTPKSGGRELDGRTWDEFPETREAVTT